MHQPVQALAQVMASLGHADSALVGHCMNLNVIFIYFFMFASFKITYMTFQLCTNYESNRLVYKVRSKGNKIITDFK